MKDALAKIKRAALGCEDLAKFFNAALVEPVLTAHPTELRRKSMIDAETAITRLLADRDAKAMTPEEPTATELALRCETITVTQTNLLHDMKPPIIDEVANSLADYQSTFL